MLKLLARGDHIDVVLADITMPELDGISLIKEVKAVSPDTQIVMLSMHENEKYITKAFMEGAAGYLLKSVSADELTFALKHVHTGGRYICSEIAMPMLDKRFKYDNHFIAETSTDIEFSTREIEVLQLIAKGLTSAEMSDKLFLSKRTIEGHRQSLIDKTGSRNSAALIRFAVMQGIVQ